MLGVIYSNLNSNIILKTLTSLSNPIIIKLKRINPVQQITNKFISLQSSSPTYHQPYSQIHCKFINSQFQSQHSMSQNRQQKPISPQQMFSRLLSQSYREAQCQDKSSKIKKQRIILIQLIQQYERSIQSQLIKINQCGNLQRLRMQRIQQLERLKRQRDVVDQSVEEELTRISLTQGQQEQKVQLIRQMQQVRCVNNKIRLKLRDLYQYVQKLEIHNRTLQSEKDIIQTKMVTRMRVNSEDWRQNVEVMRRKQEFQQNQLKTRILQKQTESLKNIRRQQEQIHQRNQQKWDQFRTTAFQPNIIPSYQTVVSGEVRNFVTKRLPDNRFQRFRVI